MTCPAKLRLHDWLAEADREALLLNDDVAPPDKLDSRLICRAPKKDAYRLIVTSFRPATGAYRLLVREAKEVGEPVGRAAGESQGAPKASRGEKKER